MSSSHRPATVATVCALALGLAFVGCGGDGASNSGSETAATSGGEHTHADGTTHSHAAMDTVARRVGLQADGSDLAGHATVLRGGDTLRVLLEVRGASADARYDARLLAGDCGSAGDRIATLTPVLTGSSGSGSSQATVPGSAVSGHAHGAVHVLAAGGDAAACAPVHLGREHSHDG